MDASISLISLLSSPKPAKNRNERNEEDRAIFWWLISSYVIFPAQLSGVGLNDEALHVYYAVMGIYSRGSCHVARSIICLYNWSPRNMIKELPRTSYSTLFDGRVVEGWL